MMLRRHRVKNTAEVENTAAVLVQEKEVFHDNAKVEKQHSKTEIFRMSVADLKAYAPTIGIESTEESTGADLKKAIVEKLGL